MVEVIVQIGGEVEDAAADADVGDGAVGTHFGKGAWTDAQEFASCSFVEVFAVELLRLRFREIVNLFGEIHYFFFQTIDGGDDVEDFHNKKNYRLLSLKVICSHSKGSLGKSFMVIEKVINCH